MTYKPKVCKCIKNLEDRMSEINEIKLKKRRKNEH